MGGLKSRVVHIYRLWSAKKSKSVYKYLDCSQFSENFKRKRVWWTIKHLNEIYKSWGILETSTKTLTERHGFTSLRPTFLQVLLSSSKDIYIYLPRGRGFTEKEARKAPIHNS